MLKFEFVQPGEFEEPYYAVSEFDTKTDSIQEIGRIEHFDYEWLYADNGSFVFAPKGLIGISNKINELNQATQAQRILGVF